MSKRAALLRSRAIVSAVVVGAVCLAALGADGQNASRITRRNWGAVVSPVYGSSQPGYPNAELFAAPRQFGDEYYHGVLPNGRIVRPAGTSVQQACVGFRNLGQFVAAVNVSHNLGIPFVQLKARMTGDNAMSLGQAIHALRPTVDADAESRTAQRQADAMVAGTR